MNRVFRLDVYVPETHLESLKQALFEAGAGKLGNYDSCCWQTRGTGQFCARDGARPYLGKPGVPTQVEEWKLELIVPEDALRGVIRALKKAHPYETPAFQFQAVGTDETDIN